jgi:uncharacterized protein (DUF2062 family)
LRFILYIDPALGSMIIQAVVAGFAAVGIFFISFRKRIATWFRRKFKAKSDANITSTDKKDEGN